MIYHGLNHGLLIKVSWVEWMGRNFNDYPGFQPKTTPAQRCATSVLFWPQRVGFDYGRGIRIHVCI